MHKKLFILWLVAQMSMAGQSQVSSEKDSTRALRDQMLKSMQGFNPAAIPGFSANPQESALRPDEHNNNLPAAANQRLAQDTKANEVYQQANQSHAVTPNMDSPEMQRGGDLIENAQTAPGDVGCADGQCDGTAVELSDDINEGLSRLGTVAANAQEVADKQIGSGNPAIFTGQNYQCRIAVAGIGNCCGGRARFLNCRAEEKALSLAITEGRAAKVGRYCAVRKVGICWEEKESWCFFSSKLAGIIQIQGRLNQLGINFGWAQMGSNKPNCRGITPEELARINFQALNLSAITQDFKNKMVVPNAAHQSQMNQAHVEQLNAEGRAHD